MNKKLVNVKFIDHNPHLIDEDNTFVVKPHQVGWRVDKHGKLEPVTAEYISNISRCYVELNNYNTPKLFADKAIIHDL